MRENTKVFSLEISWAFRLQLIIVNSGVICAAGTERRFKSDIRRYAKYLIIRHETKKILLFWYVLFTFFYYVIFQRKIYYIFLIITLFCEYRKILFIFIVLLYKSPLGIRAGARTRLKLNSWNLIEILRE